MLAMVLSIGEGSTMLSQQKSRDILRSAIDERNERQKRVDAAKAAFARAVDLQREAKERLTTLGDVDQAIISHGADVIRSSVDTGERPANLRLPKDITARCKARDEAQEKIVSLQAIRQTLSHDLENARSELDAANVSVNQAARSVLEEKAIHIAERLHAVKREEWALAARLRGLAELWLPTADRSIRPMRLSKRIAEALAAQEPQYPTALRPEAQYTVAWRASYTSLLVDTEAPLDRAL
jgi:hypothetical protein